jgi:hypothetical protein
MRRCREGRAFTCQRGSTSSSTRTAAGSGGLTRYDEFGFYYNADGEVSERPAKIGGKNLGFAPAPGPQGGYGGGDHGYKGGRHQEGGGGYKGGSGYGDGFNKGRYQGGGGFKGGKPRYNQRGYDDDFDDPVLAEFGGDDYYDERQGKYDETDKKMEQAFKFQGSGRG